MIGGEDMEHRRETRKLKNFAFGERIALALFVVVVGFFLWTEHQAHVLSVLPYLILLLCPLFHLFMHKGHGKGH
jgi:L-asparagine transporter-like permease